MRTLLRRFYRALFGRPPNVWPWHPDWLDYRHVAALIKAHTVRGSKILHVRRTPGWLDQVPGADHLHFGELDAASPARDLVLIEVQRTDLPEVRSLIDSHTRAVAPGGEVAVFLKESSSLPHGHDLAEQVVAHVELLAPKNHTKTRFSFAGGAAKWAFSEHLNQSYLLYRQHGKVALPVAVLSMVGAVLSIAINNFRQRRAHDDRVTQTHCSSFLIVLSR